MRAYRLFDADRAAEIVAAIRDEEWEDGRSSANKISRAKRNLELRSSPYLAEIESAIRSSPIMAREFITRIVPPKFNRYFDDGHYDTHADAALMGDQVRTDLACTVFLTEDYEGGDITIGGVSYRGKPGTCVVYECWRPHSVAPVTRGERICAVTWLQSLVPSAEHRDLLNMVHEVTVRCADQDDFAKLGAVHEKLVKMWMR